MNAGSVSVLGTLLLIGSLTLVTVAVAAYVLAVRGVRRALNVGRVAVPGSMATVTLAFTLLAYLFITQRYDIAYVATYSSNELPVVFRVAALWAGQPGSLLLWALLSLLVVTGITIRTDRSNAHVPIFALLPTAALLVFTLVLAPFAPTTDARGLPLYPEDGNGLNELLYNPWMVVHPPVLFAGYALLVIPFAYALAALLRREPSQWVRAALPWTLAGWSVLGLALLLGGYWAYETLGWGGYWGWDPVENSALVPWLITTALVHTMLIQRQRGALSRTTSVLALLTYSAVFYATYLTRSGVLADFSVHTFALAALQPAMTAALVLLMVLVCSIFAWGWRSLPRRPLSDALLSRESFIVLLVFSLAVIAALVVVGTSMPLISAIPGLGYRLQALLGGTFPLEDGSRFTDGIPVRDGRFSLTADFYTSTVPLFGLFTIALLTIGPLLGWRDTSYSALIRALRWPFVLGIGITCGAILLGVRDWLPLMYIALASFALGTNLVMIVRSIRRSWLGIGGYLAHVGVALFLLGVTASLRYASPDQRIVLPQGEVVQIFGTNIIFDGWRVTPERTGALDITIERGGWSTHLSALHYYIPRRSATMTTPAIHTELFRDLYITPIQYVEPHDPNVARFIQGSVREIGPYQLTLLDAQMPESTSSEAEAILRFQITDRRSTFEVTTTAVIAYDLQGRQVLRSGSVAALGDNHTLRVDALNPRSGEAQVRIDGLNLPVSPAYAVVQASVKPGVMLVWVGMIVTSIGGGIAIFRRMCT